MRSLEGELPSSSETDRRGSGSNLSTGKANDMKKRIGIGDIFGRESERKPARGSVRRSMRRSMTLILSVVMALTLTALPAGAAPADGAATGDAPTPSAIVENSTLGQPPRITALITEKSGGRGLRTMGRVVGIGTADEPLEITNADQLAEIAELTNAGELESSVFGPDATGKSVYIKLVNDISLSTYGKGSAFNNGKGWIPIGTYDNPFKGSFDGGGHEISGLYINNPDLADVGLFGYVNSKSAPVTIQNVGVVADITVVTGRNSYVGGVVGWIGGSNNITVSGCYSTGVVTGAVTGMTRSANVGGVAGYIESKNSSATVKNCYATSAVTATATGLLSSANVGGVVGYIYSVYVNTINSATVENCYATGAVTATVTGTGSTANVGGVVGSMYSMYGGIGSSTTVKNCYATGAVTATGTGTGSSAKVGGVVGSVASLDNSATVKNCCATGAVTGTGSSANVGGVVGYVESIRGSATVENCYATGAVTGTGSTANVGGVVGCMNSTYNGIATLTSSAALNSSVKTAATSADLLGRVFGSAAGDMLDLSGQGLRQDGRIL
jgi:hypothetical protein